jgi:Mrp family chromosome partitioning ATPase
MSALDQAFIKAFAKDGPAAAPLGPRAATRPSPLVSALASGLTGGASATHETAVSIPLPAGQQLDPPAASMAKPHVAFPPAPQASEIATAPVALPAGAPAAQRQWRIDQRHSDSFRAKPAGDTARESTLNAPPPADSPAIAAPPAAANVPAAPAASLASAPAVAPPPVNRPLSSYAVAAPTVETFRPAFEVDRFVWPAACASILSAADGGFESLANELYSAAQQQDRKVVAFTGLRPGEGRSHVLLALARRLADKKIQAVLVDGDFANAQLARQLGLAVRVGFDDVLAGELELADVLVDSIADGLTLLPLHEKLFEGVELKDKLRMTITFGILRDHYDLVLVDAGTLERLDSPRVHCFTPGTGLDGAIVVQDQRHAPAEQLAACQRILRERGVPLLGVVENFVQTARSGA